MSEEARIEARVQSLLETPLAAEGYALLEVQYRQEGRWVLRLIVDRDGGIGLEACTAMSKLAGRLLEDDDPIVHAFSLEVSSPGLYRPLREPRHFEQSQGKWVRIVLAEGYLTDQKQRTFRGLLEAVEATEIRLTVPPVKQRGKKTKAATESPPIAAPEQLAVPFEAIKSARLDPEL